MLGVENTVTGEIKELLLPPTVEVGKVVEVEYSWEVVDTEGEKVLLVETCADNGDTSVTPISGTKLVEMLTDFIELCAALTGKTLYVLDED